MNNITEFTFETTYNQKAMTTMARALRKTVRKNTVDVLIFLDGSLRF